MEKKTIAQIVSANYKTASVFSKYNIDFCCGGKQTLQEVCLLKNLSLNQIIQELEIEQHSSKKVHDYNSWNISFLIDYIIQVHHKYIREHSSSINELANKVSKVHGLQHPELIIIRKLFFESSNELLEHLDKEEQVLFPMIKQLDNINTDVNSITTSIQYPLIAMEQEHESVGGIYKQIRELSNNYIPPLDACNSYKVLLKSLEEFENDLHQHIHLENNILFPKIK